MKQRVHNVSYLAVATLDFSAGVSQEIVALPAGAQVISVQIEISSPSSVAAELDLGLEGQSDYFANNLATNTQAHHTSAKAATITINGAITATLSQELSDGAAIVRVLYFLPTEIIAEY